MHDLQAANKARSRAGFHSKVPGRVFSIRLFEPTPPVSLSLSFSRVPISCSSLFDGMGINRSGSTVGATTFLPYLVQRL